MKTQKLICGYIGIEKRMMVFRGQGGGGKSLLARQAGGKSHISNFNLETLSHYVRLAGGL